MFKINTAQTIYLFSLSICVLTMNFQFGRMHHICSIYILVLSILDKYMTFFLNIYYFHGELLGFIYS